MANIINQAFGNNWSSYNADCNFGMSNLPNKCINLSLYSPPFVQIYIYSDSVADMGNSSDEAEFFEGYEFTLKELHRVTKDNGYQAIHCKDLMRYMNSHGYSGQDDFPGKIIRLAEKCGWTFQRWITIWKNPVVEMQRTKTYGLLHKSFQERAEVVRQGAPDVVLVLRKQKHSGEYYSDVHMPELPESVKDRIKAIWAITAKTESEKLKIINKILWDKKANEFKAVSQELDSLKNLDDFENLDVPSVISHFEKLIKSSSIKNRLTRFIQGLKINYFNEIIMANTIKRLKDHLLESYQIKSLSEVEKLDILDSLKDHLISIRDNDTEGNSALAIHNMSLGAYNPQFIDVLSKKIKPGRLCFVRCMPLPRYHEGKIVGYFDMMGEVIQRFENQGSWKFHTRITLADGTYLVGFRNWTNELKKNYKELNGQVKHSLTAPKDVARHEITRYYKDVYSVFAGSEVVRTSSKIDYDAEETYIEYQDQKGVTHHDYVGNDPPRNWHDDGYYSILVWQKYASPVWSDLDGLPKSHPDAWMDIDQTNVLNFKAAKDPEDQKHICPLQLDLSERLILEYSRPGEIVLSPFGGISSEGYTAIKLDRKAILFELKPSYWRQGTKYLTEAEKTNQQVEMKLEIV